MSTTGWIATLLVAGMAYGLLIVTSRWVFEMGYQSK
jgi:hypothetical protein